MASKTVQGPTFTAGDTEIVFETPIFILGGDPVPVGKVLRRAYPEGGRATWRMIAVDAQWKELGAKIVVGGPDYATIVDFFTQASKKAAKKAGA
jgi:hypothetical protein